MKITRWLLLSIEHDFIVVVYVFSRIALHLGSYQIQIVETDKEKTICFTRYGSYEFLMMAFGLTNAPITFCTLMNDIF
jgi:hypothetical protein